MSIGRRIVIIPAAGRAVRFNGTPKELLPIGENRTCLHAAVDLARRIGTPVIVTSPVKRLLHEQLFPDIRLLVQDQETHPELWGAILTGIEYALGHSAAVILGDTVTNFDVAKIGDAPLNLGLFTTQTPERFTVLRGDRLVTKQHGAIPAQAWGVLRWDAAVNSLLSRQPASMHYDEVFNIALATVPHDTFALDYYHDLGSFTHYRAYLESRPL